MSNVVFIKFQKRKKNEEDFDAENFEKIQKKNKEKAEKIKQERLRANKNVLRSYRIKN